MTPVNRKLARRSSATVYDGGRKREIVIEIPAGGLTIGFRLARRRTTYYLPTDYCFREALRAELVRQKAERAKARKERNRG